MVYRGIYCVFPQISVRFLAQYIPWYHYQACICYALSIFKDFINKKSRLNQRIDTVDQKSLENRLRKVTNLGVEFEFRSGLSSETLALLVLHTSCCCLGNCSVGLLVGSSRELVRGLDHPSLVWKGGRDEG